MLDDLLNNDDLLDDFQDAVGIIPLEFVDQDGNPGI